MNGGDGLLLTATLHVRRGVETSVYPMAERDRVVVHLDYRAALHLDRDGIAVLTAALEQARAELDAAQDDMADAITAAATAGTTLADTTQGASQVGTERISA